ncbi:MAG: polyprenyl synthetase family protein [Candidatus Latescibacterota bacterium]|nr:MAG: polyprenyl synthetase family protein [Candidatus Latescibacterota bacterium]
MNLARKLLGSDTEMSALVNELLECMPHLIAEEESLDPALWDKALLDPARDIMGRSGKELRARFLERCWHIASGGNAGPPAMLPALIELLHVGSLVIDDIEDDSPTRRGEPALHRRYGVPLALNTGNWLSFLPFALLSRVELDSELRLAIYDNISLALLRCHQGQALDLSIKVTSLPQRRVSSVVGCATRLKTGSLMELAAFLGARAAGAPPQLLTALVRFGRDFGVGLQMLDDWSGIAVEARRAKGIEDIRLARPTWPWAWLADECDEITFAGIVHDARSVSIDWEAERLIGRLRDQLASIPRTRIHEYLERALDDVRAALDDSSNFELLREDVRRLENAYG